MSFTVGSGFACSDMFVYSCSVLYHVQVYPNNFKCSLESDLFQTMSTFLNFTSCKLLTWCEQVRNAVCNLCNLHVLSQGIYNA